MKNASFLQFSKISPSVSEVKLKIYIKPKSPVFKHNTFWNSVNSSTKNTESSLMLPFKSDNYSFKVIVHIIM